MNARLPAAVGVALATFLVVAGALTEALSTRIAFSALVGLPIGIAAGVVAGAATRTPLWQSPRARTPCPRLATS